LVVVLDQEGLPVGVLEGELKELLDGVVEEIPILVLPTTTLELTALLPAAFDEPTTTLELTTLLPAAFDEPATTLELATLLDGFTLDGLTLDWVTLNGLTLDGFTLDGLTLDWVTLDGLTLDGTTVAEPVNVKVPQSNRSIRLNWLSQTSK